MRRVAIVALLTAALTVALFTAVIFAGCSVEEANGTKEANGTRRNKEVVYVTSINAMNGFTTFKLNSINSNEYITDMKIPAKYSVPEKTYTYRINGTRCIVATNNVCYSFNEIK